VKVNIAEQVHFDTARKVEAALDWSINQRSLLDGDHQLRASFSPMLRTCFRIRRWMRWMTASDHQRQY
jgi:hypothetical protein